MQRVPSREAKDVRRNSESLRKELRRIFHLVRSLLSQSLEN